jgi:hypothetical protein
MTEISQEQIDEIRAKVQNETRYMKGHFSPEDLVKAIKISWQKAQDNLTLDSEKVKEALINQELGKEQERNRILEIIRLHKAFCENYGGCCLFEEELKSQINPEDKT